MTVLRLTIADPTNLHDIAKWARIAEAIGVPPGSPVKAGLDNVSVTTNLTYLPNFVDDAEDDAEDEVES